VECYCEKARMYFETSHHCMLETHQWPGSQIFWSWMKPGLSPYKEVGWHWTAFHCWVQIPSKPWRKMSTWGLHNTMRNMPQVVLQHLARAQFWQALLWELSASVAFKVKPYSCELHIWATHAPHPQGSEASLVHFKTMI